jgi:hypothetical protein
MRRRLIAKPALRLIWALDDALSWVDRAMMAAEDWLSAGLPAETADDLGPVIQAGSVEFGPDPLRSLRGQTFNDHWDPGGYPLRTLGHPYRQVPWPDGGHLNACPIQPRNPAAAAGLDPGADAKRYEHPSYGRYPR